MTYLVIWGREQRRSVSNVADLDATLDEIEASGKNYSVGIYPPADLDNEVSPWDEPPAGGFELGIGQSFRSFLLWVGPEEGIGYQTELPPWPEGEADVAFDYGGDPVFCGPERARVTPDAARQAVREYVQTGQRPTCVQWH